MNRHRKILILFVIVLIAAILIPVIRHYQLRAATEAYIAELKAQGEPMELAQVIPPPVPPEQNAAPLITNALNQIKDYYTTMKSDPPGSRMIIPGKEMIGWRQPAIHDFEFNVTKSWEQLGTELGNEQNNLNDFRNLIKIPVFDFGYEYSNSKTFIPALALRLSGFKTAAQWLIASSFYNLHQGKSADACTDVRAILAFVKGETNERFEISQLVRFAIAQMSASATWEILQATNVSNEDLAQLQQDWESLEFAHPLENAFLFERVNSLELQKVRRRSPAQLLLSANLPSTSFVPKSVVNGKLTDWNGSSTNFVLVDAKSISNSQRPVFIKIAAGVSKAWHCFFLWPQFESYKDELQGLREWRIIFAATRMAETNASFQGIQSFVNTNFSQIGFNLVEENPYAIFSRNANQLPALHKAVMAEVTRNVVITAIALKRYELRHHQLPATLAELTPDLLKTVPIDCMDGQPLRYRPNADGTFLLYSVGENGKDDGGDPSLEKGVTGSYFSWQNAHALDWVWPQPATEEEIQRYYAQQKNSR
jgi:hypothetical protein